MRVWNPETVVREFLRLGCIQRSDSLNVKSKTLESGKWARFVRTKLVPFHMVMPVTTRLQEWSREYRDLLFEMAEFLQRGGLIDAQSARHFASISKCPAVRSFSNEEIQLMLAKVKEYRLRESSQVDRKSSDSGPAK